MLQRLRTEASSPAAAYKTALEIHRLRSGTDGVGYFLYAVNEQGVVARGALDGLRGHLTIGRHLSCDFVLPDSDEAVSLKHALVRLSVLDDGLPLLCVLDLDSGIGFELSDGSRQRSVLASGAVTFRIGGAWIVALPMNTACPNELVAPVVRHVDDSSGSIAPRAVHFIPLPQPVNGSSSPPGSSGASSLPDDDSEAPMPSMISVMPPSIRLSERASAGIALWRARDEGEDDGFELLLQSQEQQAGVVLSELDVSRGVLIGRDPRCIDVGLRALLNVSVSRVHALVIRERRGVTLYDLGSMNGTFDGARRVRSMILRDEGSHVTFGGGVKATMFWRALR